MAATNAQLHNVGENGFVSAEDVLFLRRAVFQDGVVGAGEIDALFDLARRAPAGDPQWPMFFAEAAADFFLREEEPQGYLTDEEFGALKARIGVTPNALTLELLIRLAEKATRTPEAMTAFTAAALKTWILGRREPRITKADAGLVSRFIYAGGGAGNVGVMRAEAELLFDLNDATRGVVNDPVWAELFVKGIAAHLMAQFTFSAPDRNEAVRAHAFAADHSSSVRAFFKRMVFGGLAPLDQRSAQAARNDARDGAVDEAKRVTIGEADWLADRIGRDGVLQESERRLVARIRELGAELPPKLKSLVERAA